MEDTSVRRLAQEPKGCRWINGDPKESDWQYCQGTVSKSGGSWCEEHEARVFGWVKTEAAAA